VLNEVENNILPGANNKRESEEESGSAASASDESYIPAPAPIIRQGSLAQRFSNMPVNP
jgi:hypothetical protein